MYLALLMTLDAALGFVAGLISRGAVWRFAAWLLIPVVVAVCAVGGPQNFSSATGERSLVWYVFGYFAMFGFVATGAGTLAGYWVGRTSKSKA